MEKVLIEIINKLPKDKNGFVFIGDIWHEVRNFMDVELEYMRAQGKLELDETSNVLRYKLKKLMKYREANLTNKAPQ